MSGRIYGKWAVALLLPLLRIRLSNPPTSLVDIPLFITDAARAGAAFGWEPNRSVPTIIADINDWIMTHRELLASLLV